jgi:sodium/hydrogen antiporter
VTLLADFIALVFFYSLVYGRIERTIITASIVLTAAGMLTYLVTSELQLQERSQEVFLRLAEIGLVLLLFTDASHTDLRERIQVDLQFNSVQKLRLNR